MTALMLTLSLLAPTAKDIKMPDDPLQTLRAGHPRLILTDDQLPALRELLATDPLAGKWHDELRAEAQKLLDEPPTEFKIVGPRLLSASRQVLSRVTTLGLIYRLDGDAAIGRRGVAEMAAAASWPKWNPSHFLDTAELNNAFGMGWDWLQPVLGDQRQAILDGWRKHGLDEALKGYRSGAWWSKCHHNWNQVCNGGNAVAALAIADELPEVATEILKHAVTLLPNAVHSYAPDGGWAEGPGYWHYATRYNVYVLAALETALGTDFGLSDLPGFDRAGDFRLFFVGPTRRTFNYADAHDGCGSAEEMFWLAKRFGAPRYAWQQRQLGQPNAYGLVWFDPRGNAPDAEGVPLDIGFEGVDVAFLRGSWEDPNTTWLGIKGGDNRANHSHLDLGTFVLDALGERWFLDLGSDYYNLPGYFGRQRWTYYRLNTKGQNTLLLDGQDQNPAGKAPLLGVRTTADRSCAVFDLTGGYPQAKRVQRGAALLDRRDVLLVDEIQLKEPGEVVWQAHTAAQVEVDGQHAVLSQDGKQFYATVLGPAEARFEVHSAEQPKPEAENQGISRLEVHWPGKLTETRLSLLFSPAKDAPAPEVQPLDEWLK